MDNPIEEITGDGRKFNIWHLALIAALTGGGSSGISYLVDTPTSDLFTKEQAEKMEQRLNAKITGHANRPHTGAATQKDVDTLRYDLNRLEDRFYGIFGKPNNQGGEKWQSKTYSQTPVIRATVKKNSRRQN